MESSTAAFISLASALLGLLAANLIGLLLDIRRRHDRQTELVIALHAEISASKKRSEEQTESSEKAYAEKDSDPFALPDATDYVFESIKSDLAVLPSKAIYQVIRYYKLVGQTNSLTAGLTLPMFVAQKPKAKQKYINQLLALLDEQNISANDALRALEEEAVRRGESIPLTAGQVATAGIARNLRQGV